MFGQRAGVGGVFEEEKDVTETGDASSPQLTIAIVGLGRVGTEFLAEILKHRDKGFAVLAAAELLETPGCQFARENGIPLMSVPEIIGRGVDIDIIFDLTGSRDVRRALREGLAASANLHTVVAPETVSRLIWSLITDRKLPQVHGHAGY